MGHFSIVKLITRSAVRKPATRLYPPEKRAPFPNTRGAVQNAINECIFCGMCQRKCPSLAIAVNKDEKTWTIDRLKCMMCSHCVEVCPKDCLSMSNYYSPAVTEKTVETLHPDTPESSAKP